jgi:hypothetical protein
MMATESNPGKFRIGVGSALAGFLLYGGLQALITICQDPLTRAIVGLLNRFIHSNALRMRTVATDWLFIFANLGFGLIFIIGAIIIGARVLRKNANPPPFATD